LKPLGGDEAIDDASAASGLEEVSFGRATVRRAVLAGTAPEEPRRVRANVAPPRPRPAMAGDAFGDGVCTSFDGDDDGDDDDDGGDGDGDSVVGVGDARGDSANAVD
jgi:hypothetical protein